MSTLITFGQIKNIYKFTVYYYNSYRIDSAQLLVARGHREVWTAFTEQFS